jgi:hypothetical protein
MGLNPACVLCLRGKRWWLGEVVKGEERKVIGDFGVFLRDFKAFRGFLEHFVIFLRSLTALLGGFKRFMHLWRFRDI